MQVDTHKVNGTGAMGAETRIQIGTRAIRKRTANGTISGVARGSEHGSIIRQLGSYVPQVVHGWLASAKRWASIVFESLGRSTAKTEPHDV